MAKLSGFFMSTLLIVLCLWINVCLYPNATRSTVSAAPDDAVLVEEARFPSSRRASESAAPTSERPSDAAPSAVESNDEETDLSQDPTLAQADLAPSPLDVSASSATTLKTLEKAPADPASTAPVLAPASFSADGAEIADAPAAGLDATSKEAPALAAKSLAAADSNALARRSTATKPRGAKYVRVPEVEIDAFTGGVRVSRSSNDEVRVVGAARAGQVKRVAPPAP